MTNDRTWPIEIRLAARDRARVGIDFAAYWDMHGFVLTDANGGEHHFGLPEPESGSMVFTWIASYTNAGRDDWVGEAHDALTSGAFQLGEGVLGSKLSPLTKIALDGVVDFSAHKGFAFDPERQSAVRTFAALRVAGETFDPDEVYVYGATNGLRRMKDAQALREYALRAIERRRSQTVGRKTITLDPGMADRMIDAWRVRLVDSEDEG